MSWVCRALFSAVLAFAAPAFAALVVTEAPPRSSADLLAILEAHKPDPERVNRLRDIANKPTPALSDPIDMAKFLAERGRAAGELGMVERQQADLHKAYDLMPPSEPERWFLYIELRFAEMQAGDYAAALRQFELGPGIAVLPGQKISAWAALAATKAGTGDLPAARKALEQAQAIFANSQRNRGYQNFSNGWQGIINRSRARILQHEGKLVEAEATLREALAQWERQMENTPRLLRAGQYTPSVASVNRTFLAWRNQNLLPLILEQSRYVEAELLARDTIKRSLEVFGKYSPETALSLTRMAGVVFEQGRYEEASVLAKAAVDIQQQIGAAPYSLPLANARKAMAGALVEAGKYAQAVTAFEAMREGLKQAPTAATEGIRAASPSWIYALIRVGRTEEALRQARAMYKFQLGNFGEQIYSTLEARGFLAMALAADRQFDEALKEYRAAVPALLQAASERSSEEGVGLARATRLTRILQSYIGTLGHYAENDLKAPGLDPIAEAFRISDAARGSAVQRALTAASARAAIRDPDLARLAREEQDAGQRLSSLNAILVDLLARPAEKSLPTVIAAMRRDVDALRARRTQLKQEIEKRFPEYANLVDPKPVSLEQARATLHPGEALVVLYGTEERVFAWALPHAGPARFHSAPLPQKDRDATVAALRKALDVGDVPLARFPAFDTVAAHGLYQALLAPLEPAWGKATNLLIVPHGSLSQLPFALLVTKPQKLEKKGVQFEEYRSVDWLARRVAVTQLPSIGTLASLRSVKRERPPSRTFAGFGDPIFSTEQVALGSAGTTRGVFRLRSAPFAEDSTKRLSSQLGQLSRLPDTADELQDISRVLGSSQEDLFLGARASEQNVKAANLADRRIIAFATHGLIPGDLDGLTQPALALSNPAVTGEKDADGLLAMDEILALQLNADWVVLSACNTASAGGAGEEALSGLGRAFFYAGARALLVSNWPVETVSAKMLTTDIFRRQAADPKLARSEALRQAMLALVDNGVGHLDGQPPYAFAHPMFWAPFTLVGDGN